MEMPSIEQNVLDVLFDGLVPLLPPNLPPSQEADWLNGVWFESAFFHCEPNLLKPSEVEVKVLEARASCLRTLCQFHFSTEKMEWISAKVNRLVFTGSPSDQLCEEMNVLVASVVMDTSEVREALGLFGSSGPVTPSRWFQWLIDLIPKERRPAVPKLVTNHIFKLLAIFGNCADVKPSKLAAAMVVTLLGDTEAEPFLCGYKVSELHELTGSMNLLLDTHVLNWRTAY